MIKAGDLVFVVYEGTGVVVDVDQQCQSAHVRIDSDGVVVAASLKQILPLTEIEYFVWRAGQCS